MIRRRILALLLTVIGTLAVTAGNAQEEADNDIPMFRGNAARTGEMPGPGPDPAHGVQARWRFATDGVVISSPAVVDGVVYVGNVYALEAAQPVLETGATAEVTEDGTAVRGGPGEAAVVRTELDMGARVGITGEAVLVGETAWWPVAGNDASTSGWINGDALQAVWPE